MTHRLLCALLLGPLAALACGEKATKSEMPEVPAQTGQTTPKATNTPTHEPRQNNASDAAPATELEQDNDTTLARDDASVGEETAVEIPFESVYVGKHKLGVNRVNDGERTGPGRIVREANALVLTAQVEKGPYSLAIAGIVKPVSKLEFTLEGTLKGVPNLEFRSESPKERTTEGTFTFRSTKGRRYWRLYEVDGNDCVCDDDCGNEFCYIDLGF